MQAVAPTMLYDLKIMGDASRGGTIPDDVVRRVTIPALVIAGSASPAFFRDTAERLAELLPQGKGTILDGHDHGAPAEVVASVVAAFLSEQTTTTAA
jgi:pimeloyl-ACP methyl ester carboxylesterase